ncbi:MAG TPA: acetyl-CoA carboxylase carboxyltransferase subunit alpha [Armatimonadota bacterium]|jgi:acetyl-CoA carboxylase carboxyl transferase subunit alpha
MLKNALDFEKPVAELDAQIDSLQEHMRSPGLEHWCRDHDRDYAAEIADLDNGLQQLKRDRERLMKDIFGKLTPWEKTQVARHKDRPHTIDLIRLLTDDFFELKGDRGFADDPAIIGGMATISGRPILIVGHEKGRDLKDKVRRNYGSAKPEGYRKAVRLMKLAERANRPVVTLIDTSAADSSLGSEERGISEAIAKAMEEMAMLRVPIIVVVIGEGGSGGAIGIGVGDRVVMMEHAVYSVIPPEGCANILWRDSARANEAADALKLTAQDALRLGVIDEVLPEPMGGAHRNAELTAIIIRDAVLASLDSLARLEPDALVEQRYQKFRKMGQWVVERAAH